MLLLVIRIIRECKFADIKCCADFLFSRGTYENAVKFAARSHRMYIHQFSRTAVCVRAILPPRLHTAMIVRLIKVPRSDREPLFLANKFVYCGSD